MLPEQNQCAELMQALAEGDDRALRELVRIWEPGLLSFTYRYVQNEADARDLVQETFVRLYRNAASYRPQRSFAAWIFTIAANLCRNSQRWHRRHPNVSIEEAEDNIGPTLACGRPSPDDAAEQTERVRAVRAAIAELPHELRTVLLLYEYEDFGYREIAEALGCSEKGVEFRLSRARVILREKLTRWLESDDGGRNRKIQARGAGPVAEAAR